MKHIGSCCAVLFSGMSALVLSSCSTTHMQGYGYNAGGERTYASSNVNVDGRLPQHITTSEKEVIVDPREHAWGAYDKSGNLVRTGLASAGSDYCPDLHRPCHTSVGSYRVQSLGDASCRSHIFPIPRGGAPMPYCMYFRSGMALHGVSDSEVADANLSHGCVRMHVADAEWLRYNFVNVGTRVTVRPY